MNKIRRGPVDVDGMKPHLKRRGPVSVDGLYFKQEHYKFCLDCLSKEDISSYEWILDRTDDDGEINTVIYSSNDGKSQKTVDLSTVVNYWLRNHVYSQTLSKLDDEKTIQLEMEDIEKERQEERKIESDKLIRELLFSFRDYTIKVVREELVSIGVKVNRSMKCLSEIRSVLKKLSRSYMDIEKSPFYQWIEDNEGKINELHLLEDPDFDSSKPVFLDSGVRNYFKSRPLFHDCMILLDVSDYRNPLWDSFTKSHSYKLSEKERRESKIDYLILNS